MTSNVHCIVMALTLFFLTINASSNNGPTPAQLAWQADEIGVIIHFNMATMAGIQGCGGHQNPPDIDIWKPTALNTSQWVEGMANLGAKYAVLVVKHGCGFVTWPSNISLPFLPGGTYQYGVQHTAFPTDVAGAFASSCRSRGIRPGYYYSLGSNAYAKHQLGLSGAQFNELVLAQVKELWSAYGDLGEIWFDGGYSQSIAANLTSLIETLQPNATVFQGFGVSKNPLRWIGTEAGTAPYPNWSRNNGNNAGGGDPNGPDFVPGEVDTTLQENDLWFYSPGHAIRTLSELQRVYHGSVGRNGNLLLDMAPTPEGLIDPAAFARYAEFGEWIRGCYGSANVLASVSVPIGNIVTLPLPKPSNLDRVVLQENQQQSETIIAYTLQATTATQSEWVTVGTGMSVGNKRIHLLDRAIAKVTGLRVILNTSSASPSASPSWSERGAASLLKSFWTVSLEGCGGSPPTPPHNCPPPASGQEVGAYDCGYGAQQKWRLEPGVTSAGQQNAPVSLVLDGLSTATKSSLNSSTKWCITVTPLNDSDEHPSPRGGEGRYTNSTRLMECDGGAAQKFVMDQFSRLTFAMPDGQTACMDCSYCQGTPSQTKMKLYTPCYGGTARPSANERFIYDKAVETLVTPFNGKCVGVCASA